MRTCSKCNNPKVDDDFPGKRGGFSVWCKNCHREYGRTHYNQNKTYYSEKSKAFRGLRAEEMEALKVGRPCADCHGVFNPWQMDWDHVHGEKAFNIAHASRRAGKARIAEELGKCELVCANCHRQRTHERESTRP